jgi:hypothetical protein
VAKISTCGDAEQMLRHYVSALSIYRKAALSAVRLSDSQKYNGALKLKAMALTMLACARADYWDHVSKHGCRNGELTGEQSA